MLFNIFWTVVVNVTLARVRVDVDVMKGTVHFATHWKGVGAKTVLGGLGEYGQCAHAVEYLIHG